MILVCTAAAVAATATADDDDDDDDKTKGNILFVIFFLVGPSLFVWPIRCIRFYGQSQLRLFI